ncbi:TetR/AcrR family transcriptional regulator [Gordonia asplenii]|uniref:TetR/AcrR family transcriptional regulator n=1 Tax=Gordonia asplenii TaxID=2725283 RepID=UPI0028A8C8E7|nr:TetR/AcrR family transcriptional regulator [Gordonia asplenii]
MQQAAVSLFARRGFAATGIRELGAEAGITSATIYHYFGNKESLLASIINECLLELAEAGVRAMRRSADPAVQLAGLVGSHVGITAVNPLTCRVAEYEMRGLTEVNRVEMQKMRDEYESMFGQVLERGQRFGAFDLLDVGLSRLAILEMCTGVAHWYRPDGRVQLVEVQNFFVNVACRMVSINRDEIAGVEFLETPRRLSSEPDSRFTDVWGIGTVARR